MARRRSRVAVAVAAAVALVAAGALLLAGGDGHHAPGPRASIHSRAVPLPPRNGGRPAPCFRDSPRSRCVRPCRRLAARPGPQLRYRDPRRQAQPRCVDPRSTQPRYVPLVG